MAVCVHAADDVPLDGKCDVYGDCAGDFDGGGNTNANGYDDDMDDMMMIWMI